MTDGHAAINRSYFVSVIALPRKNTRTVRIMLLKPRVDSSNEIYELNDVHVAVNLTILPRKRQNKNLPYSMYLG
jgi:hypothetical protein